MTTRAGEILQEYLFKMTGADFKVVTSDNEKAPKLFVGKQFLNQKELQNLESGTYDDAFIIKTRNNTLVLAGRNPIGDAYAVCAFLEDYLGCIKFTRNEEFIPEKEEIVLPVIDKVYNPAFPFRVPHFQGRNDPDFRLWHRISTFDDWGLFVHTFHRLVPPEKYFNEHPEYYSLVNGRRLQDGQLCLSNPDLIQLLIENLGSEIEKHPEKIYWSVSQNDCINYCECENCQALYKKYGNISGAYIEMANQIAEAFPDKQISTLAYQFTRTAPVNIVPRDNVNIMFCSIECNRSMPLADDPRSADFVKDMKDWSKLTHNIFAWDYVVQFKNFLTPFPNFHVLQPNIQFFRDNHVKMMFQQGSGGSWSDLSDLKQYLIAKLLWDPEANADSIVTRFINSYYGDAAPFIREYYDLTHRNLIEHQETQNLDIYGFPVFYYHSYLTPELLVKYQEIMDNAEKAVQQDSMFFKRALRARVPADFAYLDIAHNTDNQLVKFIHEIDGKKKIDPDMLAKLDRFVEDCKKTGLQRINERSLKPEDYRDFVIRKLNWQIKDNILKDADIKLLTEPSPKYPVGGAKALTDRLMGGLEFRFNWLGFENEDMIALIDLKKPKTISRLQMNFLKAVNSWVFLPTNLKLEISDDGKNFRKIAEMEGDNSDRNFLVKSIPFILEFEKTKARYVKITAISMKTCPEWHRGYGQPAWIFTDEIILE